MVEPLHIGVLAVQGAFREHRLMLERCGAEVTEIRRSSDTSALGGLERFDGIVLPGGESTTMGRLLTDWQLLEPLRECGRRGMPLFGTCAGLILLCREVEGPDGQLLTQPGLGLLDARVRRNAFGRQIDSFETEFPVRGVAENCRAVFIRAPVIVSCGPDVDVLARVDGPEGPFPVAVRQGNVLGAAFHPELTQDERFHAFFLDMCRKWKEHRPAMGI